MADATVTVTRQQLVDKVLHDDPVRPRKRNPAVPRDLETVVLKATAKDPAGRYQTAHDMAQSPRRTRSRTAARFASDTASRGPVTGP